MSIRQKVNLNDKNAITDSNFSQSGFMVNLITLPTDVSKSCNPSEYCCSHIQTLKKIQQSWNENMLFAWICPFNMDDSVLFDIDVVLAK